MDRRDGSRASFRAAATLGVAPLRHQRDHGPVRQPGGKDLRSKTGGVHCGDRDARSDLQRVGQLALPQEGRLR
eukprot:5569673-Alexandrium_andersonii.AAC.1